MRTLSFIVPGKPVPQGSMRGFTRPGGRVGMTSGNEKELKPFRSLVASRAYDAGASALAGPVSLSVVFVLPRPKGHFGTGRNEGVLKDSAPIAPTTKPDVDKLLRALLDGLTGVAFLDDSQVVRVEASKVYTHPTDTSTSPSPTTRVTLSYLAEREEAPVAT